MSQPQQVQQTPGGQREDTALVTGAAIGALMSGLSILLAGLLADAVLQVARGADPAAVHRKLMADATRAVLSVLAKASADLSAAAQLVGQQTVGALNTVLGATRFTVPQTGLPLPPSWQRIANSIHDAGLNALRDIDDVYRRAAQEATQGGLAGTRAAQAMMDKLLAQGITAFTDRSGREWELGAYCEMAVRTAVTRLSLATQLGAMGPAGMDLVVVDAPSGEHGCPKCRPFEGKILSLTGSTSVGTAASVTDARGMLRSAHVTATLADAVARGLLHPNCRHYLVPFTDGAGFMPLEGSQRGFVQSGSPFYRGVLPQQGGPSYAAQQKQRALERSVRAALLRKQLAITPAARSKANAELSGARHALNQHIADYHLTRQRYRELPGKAR